MNYKIEINHDLKAIEYRHSGDIERKSIGYAWDNILLIKEFSEGKYNLISDYRGANFKFGMESTEFINNYLYNLRKILKGKKEAVIVDKPFTTAFSLYFENKLFDEIGFYVKVFNNKKTAFDWIK